MEKTCHCLLFCYKLFFFIFSQICDYCTYYGSCDQMRFLYILLLLRGHKSAYKRGVCSYRFFHTYWGTDSHVNAGSGEILVRRIHTLVSYHSAEEQWASEKQIYFPTRESDMIYTPHVFVVKPISYYRVFEKSHATGLRDTYNTDTEGANSPPPQALWRLPQFKKTIESYMC